MAEKTEKPTHKKLNDSSKKGQILKSRDLVVTSILFMGAIYLGNIFSFDALIDILDIVFLQNFELDIHAYSKQVLVAGLKMILFFYVSILFVVCIASWIQSKFKLATEAVKINFVALNPITGFKKIFSLRTVKELFKAIIYIILFSMVTLIFFDAKRNVVFTPINYNLDSLLLLWQHLLYYFVLYFLITTLAVIVLDILSEYFLFMKDMKMDKQEVKKEYKEQEGNPEVKSMRRSLHQEILSEQLKSDILSSRLIIANPTHVAIGIYYKPEFSLIPVISVRETDQTALAVRNFAEENNIPVIRDIKLARKLFQTHKRYDFVSLEVITKILDLLYWLEEVEIANAPNHQNETEVPEEDSLNDR